MTETYQNLRQRRRPVAEERVTREQEPAISNGSQQVPQTPEEMSEGYRESQAPLPLQEKEAAGIPEIVQVQAGIQAFEPQARSPANEGRKVAIVAELSANHNQDLDLAFRTLRAIADAGADAVKLQSYDAQSLTLPLEQPPFIIERDVHTPSPWDGRSLYSLYEKAAMPWAWHKPLYKLAAQLGLEIFSTPFCLRGVDYLEQLETPCYKIASFEIGHLELVRHVAATGKPIIASLGIASFSDIERFVDACEKEGNRDITLLQCTSAYPASPTEANLAMLPHLKSTFGCRVGLSDHSMGSAVAVAAVALGAELIEKHVILSRSIGGLDASFSMEPAELASMVTEIRIAEAAIGRVEYRLNDKKCASRRFGRSIFVLRDLKINEYLRREDVAVLRPFPTDAIEPQELERIIGAKIRCTVPYGTALQWYMLELEAGKFV